MRDPYIECIQAKSCAIVAGIVVQYQRSLMSSQQFLMSGHFLGYKYTSTNLVQCSDQLFVPTPQPLCRAGIAGQMRRVLTFGFPIVRGNVRDLIYLGKHGSAT